MKKLLKSVVLAASLAAVIPAAQAGTAGPAPFNVTVTLTSTCTISAIADVAFTYTSFQVPPAASAGGGLNVTCTNGLPYTLAMDAAGGTVAGLAYTLSLSAPGGTGNGGAQPFTISGNIAGGQSGTCAVLGGVCTGSDARTLTLTF